MTKLRFSIAVLLAAFLLAGCGSSSNTAEAPTPPPPPPPAEDTAYEMARDAIASAETAAAAQKVVDDLDADAVTGTELQMLNQLVAERTMMLKDAADAMARQALVDAAMCEDATLACVAAHDALIAALQADVAELADDEDATNAQQTAAQMALNDATAKRNEVQMALDDFDRTTDTGMKVGDAIDKANELEEDRSADAIEAAKVAIEVAEEAIGEDDDSYDERIMMAKNDVARAEERNAVDMAIMGARTAIEALAPDADGDAVAAVQTLLSAAETAVDENEHLTAAEEAGHTGTIALLQVTVTQAQARVDADAEKERMAEEETEKAANAAMAATAAKLYAGISAPMGDIAAETPVFGVNNRAAAYGGTNDSQIMLSIGDGAVTPAQEDNIALSEDKKTTVADNHGWEGKRYTRTSPASDGTYEAIVYSNVEDAKMGKKFGSAVAGQTATGPYHYQLDASGVLAATEADGIGGTGDAFVPARVAFTGVTRTAGTETFELPDPNDIGQGTISIPGRYHGVSGNYLCAPTSGTACSASVAADGGFTLETTDQTWTFKPSSGETRVMDAADTVYASYGWWLHKTQFGDVFTASAFTDEKGEVPAVTDLDTLNGTATYRGGAAGKYALSSSTGGTNDAGHFTARAMLEANFTDNEITGTIDRFTGADGESRDWSVELMKSTIAANGGIAGDPDDDTDTGNQMTQWTIGETTADASGEWTGDLLNQPDSADGGDGVPLVATGTFYSMHGRAGKMVGAFGANKQ